jgi:hypothetical protein
MGRHFLCILLLDGKGEPANLSGRTQPQLKRHNIRSEENGVVGETSLFPRRRVSLNVPEYQVKTRVPCDIFGDFVKFVKEKHVQITEASHAFLRAFSEKLGFDALSAECESFEESHANACDDSSTSRYSTILVRLCGVEEGQLFLE